MEENKNLIDQIYGINHSINENKNKDVLTYLGTFKSMGDHPIEFTVELNDAPDVPSEYDPVERPEHYTHGKYECIDVMTDIFSKEQLKGFCLCNAFKYLYRCEHKDNCLQDVKKAIWYLNKYISICEERDK